MHEIAPTISKPDHWFTQATTTVGRAFFARRLLFGLLIAVAAAFLLRCHLDWSHWSLWKLLSATLVLAGLFIRALADGFAGRHTRTEEIEAPRLSTGGPYAFVRNPIYIGSMVLGLGMVGLLGNWIALIPYAAVFAIFYFSVIPAEEQFLRRTFGLQYEEYCRNVPRWVPLLRPWPKAEKRAFDWKPALGEWRVALAVIGILVFFTITSVMWK
ncbi:MAG: isoprenylcysteine carboxylmethyltransferase family protein [Verrucomicrobia bacterium]|nr:isoprenylcysteine carboxylmethyltransferase family protein [Verrucomicrobiota bacterium]